MELWTTVAPFLGIGGLLCALLIYLAIKKNPSGSQQMSEIADAIHEGSMAFLKRAVAINSIVRVILRIFRIDLRRLSSARELAMECHLRKQ